MQVVKVSELTGLWRKASGTATRGTLITEVAVTMHS